MCMQWTGCQIACEELEVPCAIAEARCPLQVLTLQYSGDSNFNPSASGQNGSPGGPTLVVVSLMPPLQSVTLPSCSAKLDGMHLPPHVTSFF